MKKIIPIRDLRNTTEISKKCNELNEPIFVTKNGYEDLVIMSSKCFENQAKTEKTLQNPNEIIKSEFYKVKQTNELGLVKCAASTINIKIGNIDYNVSMIIKAIDEAIKKNVNVIVFQELTLCGYTINDLLLNDSIITKCEEALIKLKKYSLNKNIFFVVGAPLKYRSKLFNCGVAICNGSILGVVPKSYLPNYNEFYEKRYFVEALENNENILIDGEQIPFGKKLVFQDLAYLELKIGIEICEDVWAINPPSTNLVKNGANLILNLSASNELIDKNSFRETLISSTSARLLCGYVYASSGDGESTTDVIFSGHNIIAENGKILSQTEIFKNETIINDIDIQALEQIRLENTSFIDRRNNCDYIYFNMPINNKKLNRIYNKKPFTEEAGNNLNKVILMQAKSLAQRLKSINCKKVVIGFSGGLDSTLALISTYECFKLMNYPVEDIYVYTMPSFGTSNKTKNNAIKMCEILGVTFKEINISESVKQHFKDIDHDLNNQNVTFENAQARERTQILLDIANDINAIMIGTGDLSELCLGFTTYNGDHMSNYGLNATLPKTLIQDVVKNYADLNLNLKNVLYSILETPISPELLPPNGEEISQKTEENLGPYILHDFFIYYFLKYNFSIKKIYFLACNAFKDDFKPEFIKQTLQTFIKKFFSNQFKRNCLPEGAKITSVSVSPRGDLRLPSDLYPKIYLDELESL